MKFIKKKYDFIVIGGGVSGICAALAAARNGAKTALINDRPVLGGNASSEIRMHICGADRHGKVANARETGIIEELLLKNRFVNIQHSFSVQDTVLWQTVYQQQNLDLFLNTKVFDVIAKEEEITEIKAIQLTTEKNFSFSAEYYADATGDGFIGYAAGAEYMMGEESQKVFDEPNAPIKSSHSVMGNTILFTARNMGYPVKFNKPDFAYSFTEEDLKLRNHKEISSGYWWIELGGDELDSIKDSEEIRDELLKTLYGVWDHIKNMPGHNSDNYALDWVGFLPGKRESRRLVGDYILTENDVVNKTKFYDAVAYGGWGIDIHPFGGMALKDIAPNINDVSNGIYQIPYRSLYSKNIKNLFLAGRAISVSHMAFASTRVMGTCAVVGHSIGVAAAIAKIKKVTPKKLLDNIELVQQQLLKEDAYIPDIKNIDKEDFAQIAQISASSFIKGGEPINIINGFSRSEGEKSNAFISDSVDKKQWLCLKWQQKIEAKEIIIKFDSDLSSELTISLSEEIKKKQKGFPKTLIKDFRVEFFNDEHLIQTMEITDNILRLVKIDFKKIQCDKIKFTFNQTYGIENVKVFEVRVY